ncbi:Polyketide methyltransferase sdnL [Rhypophila decipiens]
MENAFNEIRLDYDAAAEATQSLGYWKEVYPLQARLVVAYIVEAFAANGLDLSKFKAGDPVPSVLPRPILKKNHRIVQRFYEILEQEGKLISSSGAHADDESREISFIRTATPVDQESSSTIYKSLLGRFPQHDVGHELINVIGSQLAGCLSGSANVLYLIFGNPRNTKLLSDMYEFYPLLRAPNLLLGDFLVKAVAAHQSNAQNNGRPFRILEVGAGTGATTRHLLERLVSQAQEDEDPDADPKVEYLFSDISPLLVGAAKQQFKSNPSSGIEKHVQMSFEVLDAESEPKKEYLAKFDCIISTNCVHATKNLNHTLGILRGMLRPGGALMLVELGKKISWLDVVMGFFDGWWAFDDGREYPTIDEKAWEERMLEAGFDQVLWSEGTLPDSEEEAKIVRLIGGFV